VGVPLQTVEHVITSCPLYGTVRGGDAMPQ
jgi:hypothetical protein